VASSKGQPMTLSDHTLKMLLFRDPSLQSAVDRYRYCQGLLPEAVWELDRALKTYDLNQVLDDTAEIQYLQANVNLIWQELDVAEEILTNALRAEYLQFESP
jgi:hypothetical protein